MKEDLRSPLLTAHREKMLARKTPEDKERERFLKEKAIIDKCRKSKGPKDCESCSKAKRCKTDGVHDWIGEKNAETPEES